MRSVPRGIRRSSLDVFEERLELLWVARESNPRPGDEESPAPQIYA